MPNNFLEILKEKVLLIDGAMGTQLQAEGLPIGEASEKFNLDHPEIVQKIHQDYVDAGADIILTNTFGGSIFKLDANELGDKVAEINRTAAELARRAAGDSVFVAGSVGPTGQFLEPLGPVPESRMIENFEVQIKALVEGGIDIVCIETMSDPLEAVCAIKAAKNVCQLPIIASMTYEQGKAGFRTMMGNDVAGCVSQLAAAGADVIATNCGYGIDHMIGIVELIRQNTQLPVMAEPNAGLPELVGDKAVYNETSEMMAEKLPRLLAAGVNIVGGCCGTNPDYIRKFREVLDAK